MSLIDEARDNIRVNKSKCTINVLREKYPDLADELAEALADPDISGAAISRALKNRYGDEAPGEQTVNRHRNQACSCDS